MRKKDVLIILFLMLVKTGVFAMPMMDNNRTPSGHFKVWLGQHNVDNQQIKSFSLDRLATMGIYIDQRISDTMPLYLSASISKGFSVSGGGKTITGTDGHGDSISANITKEKRYHSDQLKIGAVFYGRLNQRTDWFLGSGILYSQHSFDFNLLSNDTPDIVFAFPEDDIESALGGYISFGVHTLLTSNLYAGLQADVSFARSEHGHNMGGSMIGLNVGTYL